MPDRWESTKAIIRVNRAFVVATHIFPDGDALGAELALAQILRKLGKKVLVVNDHPVPKAYRFLDPRGSAKVYTPRMARRIATCDSAFVVDVGSLERLGHVGEEINRSGMPTVCIDHHKTNDRFADVNIIDTSVASTGELIHDLAKTLRIPLTPTVATCLFVATATDTGWFRFANTTPRALRLAAELIEQGACPERVYEAIYETLGWQRMALMKRVLGTLRSECDGQIAYFYATKRMLRATRTNEEDTEGLVDLPRVLRGVRLIIFFRESDGKIKVNLRSKRGPAVDQLARKYGGGGHARAAGIAMKGTLAAAMRAILGDARQLFEHRSR